MDSRSYEVVATLGPATPTLDHARRLREAGASGFRINVSHLSPVEALRWVEKLEPLLGDCPLSIDLQGSKWRVGRIEPLPLPAGATVELRFEAPDLPPGSVPVPHEDFFRAAACSDGRVLLDDARIELRLETTEERRARARVVRPGTLGPRKGITLPATAFRCEKLTATDSEVVSLTRGLRGVAYAISYVRDAAEAARYREILGAEVRIAGKLERPSAISEAAGIGGSCDTLWLCRGDLGAEAGLAAMAEAVHVLGEAVRSLPLPVLLAGQVIEHMTHHPVPTRSEVCYLYDSLAHGFAGVVLSDETAVGEYPVEAVRTAAMFA